MGWSPLCWRHKWGFSLAVPLLRKHLFLLSTLFGERCKYTFALEQKLLLFSPFSFLITASQAWKCYPALCNNPLRAGGSCINCVLQWKASLPLCLGGGATPTNQTKPVSSKRYSLLPVICSILLFIYWQYFWQKQSRKSSVCKELGCTHLCKTHAQFCTKLH